GDDRDDGQRQVDRQALGDRLAHRRVREVRGADALTIKGLPAASSTRNYFVWADRNGQDPVFLGALPGVEGAQLPFQGVDVRTGQAVVVDPSVYSKVRVTSETTANPTAPGPTVIVGTITPPSS
ncbi:hypothetical protein AB0L40_25860, partial [Patulibacter sp. NPDC049589]|uniref:hypothetical protein n=1 Tax=Patulibacter sp. NPDC049589 TaxID=3154731 RepID=UPI003427DF98